MAGAGDPVPCRRRSAPAVPRESAGAGRQRPQPDVRLPGAALHEGLLPMSHTRPTGTGWATGQTGEPVEVQADPPGDGIGPDHTPPDAVSGLDAKEVRRLQRDHRELTKASEGDRPSIAADEPND